MKRYIRSIEQPQHEGNVGIWWFYNNKVIGEYCPLSEAVEDRGFMQFSKTSNHITDESGRVVYDPRAMVYEIICSQAIASNKAAISAIAKEFDIADLRYDVIKEI